MKCILSLIVVFAFTIPAHASEELAQRLDLNFKFFGSGKDCEIEHEIDSRSPDRLNISIESQNVEVEFPFAPASAEFGERSVWDSVKRGEAVSVDIFKDAHDNEISFFSTKNGLIYARVKLGRAKIFCHTHLY